MKSSLTIRALLALAIGLILVVPPARASSKAVLVVTTTSELAEIARAVGGKEIEVESLARGDQDPHYVPAKPSLSRKLRNADLLVYTGLQLEIGWLPVLLQSAQNPRIQPGTSGCLAASKGIDVLEVPKGETTRAEGDVHPEGNPHYALDPRNGPIIARTIAERLSELRPEASSTFTANAETFAAEVARRLPEWERRLAPLRGRPFVTEHKQWEYLARWAGFVIIDYVELRPGIPPTPRHLATLAERMQKEGVVAVIYADFWPPETVRKTAARGGVPAVALPASVGSRPNVVTTFDLFDVIVEELVKVAGRG